MDDDELVMRTAKGDEEAFRLLVERWETPVFAFLERMLGSKEDAQDLGQETFLSLYRNAGRYEPSGQFRSWLFRIAGNLARSRLRRRKILQWIRFDPSAHDVPSSQEPADRSLERDDTRMAVRAAIARLPDRQREALVLRQYEGLSYQEIAASMNITISAVESLLYRAMTMLRRELVEKRESA